MLRYYCQMALAIIIGVLMSLLAVMILGTSTVQATGAATPLRQGAGWNVSQTININNTGNPVTLTNYQLRVSLNAANFDFAHARVDGGDLRFTDSDGTTDLVYWIQSYISATQTASIWVRVPEIPASGVKAIYLWYNNYAATTTSNGDATFEFFDDFEKPSPGYYELEPASTVMTQTLPWETTAPHTLNPVQVNRDHTYYGYYGLQDCNGGIGLARSDDLTNWSKDPTPIVSTTEDARWASVVLSGTVFHMVYNNNYCYNTQIVYRTSTDGVDFGTGSPTVLIPYTGTLRHINPDLFLNPNDAQFYLYYADKAGDNSHTIKVRHAATVPELASADDQVLMSSTNVVAAPDVMYYDGTYFLSVEILEAGVWQTLVYASQSATGPFEILPDNPILTGGSACLSQHIFGTTLHAYYCKLTETTWTVEYRTANLTRGRLQHPDVTKWTAQGGTWHVISETEPNGATGKVAYGGSTTGLQALAASYTGTDYIFEGRGAQRAGRVWGLGTRFESQDDLFASNLYEDLDSADNLYLYNRAGGGITQLGSTALGTINLNTWYSMTVAVVGANVQVYLNGTLALTTTSTAHPTGRVALLGENGTAALFSDVWVRQYTSPEPTVSFEAPTAIGLTRISVTTQSSSLHAPYLLLGMIGVGLTSYALTSFFRQRRRPLGITYSADRSTAKDVHASN